MAFVERMGSTEGGEKLGCPGSGVWQEFENFNPKLLILNKIIYFDVF